ncbi:hypothetical protein [Mucilaginibacter myungsuensis]|uniref:Uncharacterized protein n=1 Tax=Mucilaginibacter myungsuensis TaxID=649104 RepID=A0A929KZT9_9SPHI|nr:hypothetical protein [Mucilaginibacter myungsuensis]MBE9663647.1 hypothetical protein [Mucilaginibacter myungsuensis]MDN3599029.1 hypothetical protein [Mucilaginibacter myungsuensis]
MKKVLLSAVLLVSIVAYAVAAGVDGAWKGLVEGQYNLTLTLKTEGDKLTGTFNLVDNNPKGENPDDAGYTPFVAAQLGKNAITEGKVDGDNITFTTTFNGKPVVYKGVIAEGKLTLTTTFNGSPQKVTLKLPKA